MDRLTPLLIRRARGREYAAVVIDPIYKLITGDENSAAQMAYFCGQFDRICAELGCSVIYSHHHSKGHQGGKKSMDRASGSGVVLQGSRRPFGFDRAAPFRRSWPGGERQEGSQRLEDGGGLPGISRERAGEFLV